MSILLGILVGLALPVQTSVNNKLRDKVGTPYNSSLVSFIISTVFLACLLLVTGQGFHLPMDQLAGSPSGFGWAACAGWSSSRPTSSCSPSWAVRRR